MKRDIQFMALRDQFAPDGSWAEGPKNGNPGTVFFANQTEAREYDAKPHLAMRLTPAPPVAASELPRQPTWEDTGIALSPDEYLRKFPQGDFADLARAAASGEKEGGSGTPPQEPPPAVTPQTPQGPPPSTAEAGAGGKSGDEAKTSKEQEEEEVEAPPARPKSSHKAHHKT